MDAVARSTPPELASIALQPQSGRKQTAQQYYGIRAAADPPGDHEEAARALLRIGDLRDLVSATPSVAFDATAIAPETLGRVAQRPLDCHSPRHQCQAIYGAPHQTEHSINQWKGRALANGSVSNHPHYGGHERLQSHFADLMTAHTSRAIRRIDSPLWYEKTLESERAS